MTNCIESGQAENKRSQLEEKNDVRNKVTKSIKLS